MKEDEVLAAIGVAVPKAAGGHSADQNRRHADHNRREKE
jgi:hypothetical protein